MQTPTAAAAKVLVPRLLNECQHSQACHTRALKQLVDCRHNGRDEFLQVWIRCLQPLFLVSKREPAAERIVKFAAVFTAHWVEELAKECEDFFEQFLWRLLDWTEAAHKTVRFRACQMISEALSKLEPHVIVGEELWDRMTSCMQTRMQDKQTSVRVFAASALSRLVDADNIENQRTVQAYRKALASDPSAEVRRMVVKCMPAANATVSDLVERIADASEAVRKAAYQTIGERLCISGLSIMQRATTLRRGLAERVPTVRTECVNLLELWLLKDCDGDPLILLKFLDVETYEKVGETVVLELLKKDFIKPTVAGLRQFLGTSGNQPQLMNVEQALFWRVICTHVYLEAQTKGREAATMGSGAQAVVIAAGGAEQNEYLESILPPTVADFVKLVDAHLHKGSACWFAARQLLLLAKLLDFTDSTSRKEAAILLQRLLRETAPSEEQGNSDNPSSQEIVGDGLSLGGEESWATVVAELAQLVHAARGEFEEVLAASVAAVARPCREGGADIRQWLHCLAITGLLLENIQSLVVLTGRTIEPDEILNALLLPAVKHLHPEVQRAGVRCLGIFCGLERSPTPRAAEQLRLSLHNPRPLVQKMALKAMFDVILCHGAPAINAAVGIETDLGMPTPHARPPGLHIPNATCTTAQLMDDGEKKKLRLPLLELLVEWLDCEALEDGRDGVDCLNYKTSIVAEGFAKVLLQNKRFADVQLMQERVVEELLLLYFSDSANQSPRLKQCLSVFFRIWCSLSEDNKRCVTKVFIPVMRKKWPGIYDRREKLGTVLVARKHATQVAHFMLHLLNLPVLAKVTKGQELKAPKSGNDCYKSVAADTEDIPNGGQEMLAVRLCAEVMGQPRKFKSLAMAGKTYVVMLCRVITLLQFRSSEEENIKVLRSLIPRVVQWLPASAKSLLKSLSETLASLKDLDRSPDNGLTDEELELFMVRMGFHDYFKEEFSPEDPSTPEVPQARRRRGPKILSASGNSTVDQTPVPTSTRSLRTQTTARRSGFTSQTPVPTSTRSLRNQKPARSSELTGTTRRNLCSVYESESTGDESDSSSTFSGVSDGD